MMQYVQYKGDWLESTDDLLMVVAAMILSKMLLTQHEVFGKKLQQIVYIS